MALSSMTGFARSDGRHGTRSWTWEARSVNSKTLDVRVRLPAGFERLEPAARSQAAERFKRGSLNLTLSLTRTEEAPKLRLNRTLVQEALALAQEIEGMGAAPPRLDALLAIRGIIEPAEEEDESEREAVEAAVTDSLKTVLDRLAAARAEEGARLEIVLIAEIDRIAAMTDEAAASAEAQPEALRRRLHAQLQELLSGAAPLPEERLAQEAALLIGRTDIREELDRLSAHVAQARDLLSGGGAVGRRLDFLCQELNREANTLCSKSASLALTQAGLDLKAGIEQFREQVQNIE
ncbi:MAG: YicC family protein [Alphaproteobacteria bacterium]|jgi:uncharacterized protein (TIGR00255 family)|nr:YicC family protein [Alphaproteobacteria bacterium]